MCLNHPETIPPPWSVEKLSSMKPVPGAKKLGITALEEIKMEVGANVTKET